MVVVQKKSIYIYETYKYECHPYNKYAVYGLIGTLTLNNDTIPSSVIFFTNSSLAFQADYLLRSRSIIQYYTQIYPKSDSYSTYYQAGTGTSVTCASVTGVQGTAYDLPAIEVISGSKVTVLYDITDILQCQGYTNSYTFYFEDSGSSPNSYNGFISAATYNSTHLNVTVDATAATAYPGQRWMFMSSSTTSSSSFSSKTLLPVLIYPSTKPNAPTEPADEMCQDNDQKYPKNIATTSGSIYYYDSDIDQYNGNMVMCGEHAVSGVQTQAYPYGYNNGWIVMMDSNMEWAWGFTADSINTGPYFNYQYYSCQFSANQTSVFGLTGYSTGSTLNPNIVRHDYITGKVIYLKNVQGTYYLNADYTFFKVDKQFNHIYLAAVRIDIAPVSYMSQYVAKIDVSLDSPTQSYYIYASQTNGQGTQQGIYSMFVSPVSDYFLIQGVQYTSNISPVFFNTLAKFAKSTGVKSAMNSFNYVSYSSGYNKFAIYSDETNAYYAFTQYSGGWYLHVRQLSLSTLSTVSGYYNNAPWSDQNYIGQTTITSDATFLYVYYHGYNMVYKYLAKFSKASMTLVLSAYMIDRQSTASSNNMILYNNNLYLFYMATSYVSPSYISSVVNQVSLTFTSPKSCVEWITFTPATSGSNTNYQVDLSSYITFYVAYGDAIMKAQNYIYFEYWLYPTRNRLYDSLVMQCYGQVPKFSDDLVDQIIQLPISSPVNYTFNWPADCFNSDLTFTWGVDRYTTPPTFMSMTNSTSTGTISLNPATTDIGTYVVRIRFQLTSIAAIYTENTFVVEVYPQLNYGQTNPTDSCPTSNIPLLMNRSPAPTTMEWWMADMDSLGSNFIMCGRVKEATYTLNPSYYAGFLLSYSKGLAVNFFLTFESVYDTLACYSHYGYQDNIQSVFTFYYQSATDSVAMYKHNKYGMYMQSAMYSTPGKAVSLYDYQIDLTTGDQYFSGLHYQTYATRGTYNENFIFKLDKNYNYVFFTTYEIYERNIAGKSLFYNSGFVYQTFQYYTTSGYYYYALQKVNSTNGTTSWVMGLQSVSYPSYAYVDTSTEYNSLGVVYANNYVYTAMYYTNSGPSSVGVEVYFIKVDPSTGSRVQSIEWYVPSGQTNYGVNLQYSSSTNYIVVAQSTYQYEYVIMINVGVTPFTYNTNVLNIYSGSTYYYRPSMFERNGMMWLFLKINYASMFYGQLYKFKDYVNVAWDVPCSYEVTTNLLYANAPSGINGDYAPSYWITLPYTLNSWTLPSDLFNRWFGNIQRIRIYPINNSSADNRYGSGNCYVYANPSAPTVANRTGSPINATAGGFSVSNNNNSFILPAFNQCSNYPMTLQAMYKNTSAFTVSSLFRFDATNAILYIAPSTNTYVGSYAITYKAYITASSSYVNTTYFYVDIVANQAPLPKLDFLANVTIYAHHNYNWTVTFDSDFEGDDPSFSAQIVDNTYTSINASVSYLYINQSDDTGIIFSVINPPQPVTQQRYVQVQVWDQFNVATPNIYNISLIVLPNYAPYMKDSLTMTIPTIYITKSFSYTFWYQNFTDAEGDQVNINCVSWTDAPDALWTHIDVNVTVAGNITIYGNTPRNNSYAGNYQFRCTVSDQWDGTPNLYTFSLQVLDKTQISLNTGYSDLYVRLPDNITESFNSASSDPLGEPNYYSLYVNNTLYDPTVFSPWLTWDNITLNLTCVPFSNSQGGNHSICIRFDDDVNPPEYINFTLQVVQNWPLIALQNLPDQVAIVNNWFFFDYNKTLIFQNPENEPFSMYFRQKDNGNALPYFVTKNFTNGTIGGFTTDSDVGSYQMECVGIDDAYWETPILFNLIVKPCYYKCNRCWDSLYNTCTVCKTNYFLYNAECLDLCITGTYADTTLWQCLSCPKSCRTCTGPDTTSQCQTCNPGYFSLNNGCYTICPDGYWGDKTDYTCKTCNSACTKCYGPSSSQCYNCTQLYGQNDIGEQALLGYVLQGNECKIPKCIDGQYFLWYPTLINGVLAGKCDTCNSRCKKCTGPSSSECSQCYPGAMLSSSSHNCTYCEEIVGMFTNEEFECEDICGDGIIINKQCDDGNTISGDGCSNICVIEYGYACPVANQSCHETIPPYFTITTITTQNQLYVTFSEPVTIQTVNDISPSNMNVQIIGSLASYSFTWRMIDDVKNPLLPGRYITKFSLILSDMMQSLDGTEEIKISFNNYTCIQDLAGNPMINNYFSQINPYPFVYLSAAEANTASSGGSSLKYTFMSVFSFNIALKLFMNSSMQYLWGLVHSLQVFNFLLFMNINFPDNVSLFTQYLSVASGDIDELNQYIPNIGDYLVNQNNVADSNDNYILSPKFQNAGVSPYFLVAYGQKLTMWCIGFFVILPIVLLMNKLCKNVKIWRDIKGSFFFNGPLRAFIEMYIELILQVIINTQFIKFRNIDCMITTAVAFGFGTIALLLPFLAMSLIYHNRKRVKSHKWKLQFGMLTEELRAHSILQLYYFPLFMFQRLMIAGIIVYVYDYPLLQCLMVIVCNLAMIGYLITVRPFKEESQQTTTVLDEFVIMICVCLFIKLYMGVTIDEQKNYGWGIIVLILFSVCKNFGVVIYIGIIKARQKLHKMFGAEDQQKDSPHTSDDEDEIGNFSSDGEFNTEELMEEIKQDQQRQKMWNPLNKNGTTLNQTSNTQQSQSILLRQGKQQFNLNSNQNLGTGQFTSLHEGL